MKFIYDFYKENGTWYIDLPSWPGEKSDLAMVLGADILLEELANVNGQPKQLVKVEFSDEEIENSKVLLKDTNFELLEESLRETAKEMGGAFYNRNGLSVWLCDVTKFVFGSEMPDKIWYKPIYTISNSIR